MSQPIQSEAHLTTFEAISMIVGNSIGTGIIAVPYLATKNSMLDVVWMVLIAYCVNVILHLIIAELSYNNGGVQLVKSFEGELFHGKMKQIFSWSVFIVYGLAIMIGVSGNINGGAQIFVNWFGMPFVAAQVLYYVIAGVVVFIGMKAVGIAQKYAVIVLMGIVAVMTVGTFMHPLNSLQRAQFHWNNLLALYSMVVFATSANQAVIQVVKGLDGNAKQIRRSIFIGFGLSSVFVLIVTGTVLLGTEGALEKEVAYMQLLYRSDPDHEWRCGTGEHHAGADLWKVQEKSRQQSYLRCDRHGTVSGADGAVYVAVCNRCIDSVELISKKLKYNSETD